ncbi:MAG TPA: MoaD/ThiS family protein [Gemmatimonadales bacterium]|jgi:molybdopterin converting factor small subunit|nr:MoaD/ThiS family protein [Gemmatimonadales bacterium]
MATTVTSTLTVRVLLFGSYAEALERGALDLTFSGPVTVGEALARLRALPGGERLPAKPLCALNLQQARMGSPLTEGDELAILPPLAGG